MGGRPKALIEVGGTRIIDRVLEAIGPAVDDLLIVTSTPALYAFLGLPMVPDIYPDHGSLGGIYSGLKAAAGEAAFTVACDMPFLHSGIARLVVSRAAEADIVIPRVGDQLETMHAAYSKACLPHIEERLHAGRFRITGFFDRVRVLEIPEHLVAKYRAPAVAFMNVNTPDDLSHAERIAKELSRS